METAEVSQDIQDQNAFTFLLHLKMLLVFVEITGITYASLT